MSQKATPPPSSWAATEVRVLRADDLARNDWNPNKMNAFQYAKLHESIGTYGFLDPLLVRPHNGGWQIVDGEHRYDVGLERGMTEFPCVIRDMDDATAMKLTLIANELHGQADPESVSTLLKHLLDNEPAETLLQGMPFDDGVLKGFLGFNPLPPLSSASGQPPGDAASTASSGGDADRWVERTYRLPSSVADVVDDALERAKANELAESGQVLETFQALEVIAAEYLAG